MKIAVVPWLLAISAIPPRSAVTPVLRLLLGQCSSPCNTAWAKWRRPSPSGGSAQVISITRTCSQVGSRHARRTAHRQSCIGGMDAEVKSQDHRRISILRSQPHVLHRRLVTVCELPVHSDMLVDCQRSPLAVSGDKLQFGIRQPGVPCQPRDCLVPKSMGRGVHAHLLGILFHDLLDPPRAELPRTPGLEEPAVLGMRSDVGAECGSKTQSSRTVKASRAPSHCAPVTILHKPPSGFSSPSSPACRVPQDAQNPDTALWVR